MADSPKTSFIPKQNTSQAASAPKRRRTFNVFNFIIMVVFLGAVLLSLGVYFLKARSESQLEAKKLELAEVKETFSRGDIESLRELDRRIDVASRLLNSHLSPSLVFDMLERRTQGLVQFISFQYNRNESGTVALSMNGIAPRFNTVALQSREFAQDAVIERALFTDLDVILGDEEEGDEGNVTFSVTGKIDTSIIPYTPQTVSGIGDISETTEDETATSSDESAETGEETETEEGNNDGNQ